MFYKALLISTLAAVALSLECVFEVLAEPSSLDIEGGVDKCESSDQFCAKIDVNGIKAKGCSKTAGKISGQGLPEISCTKAGCDTYETVCCCEGNNCNGATAKSVLMAIVTLPVVLLAAN